MGYADKYDTTRCLNCGKDFIEETKYCPNCGQRNRAAERTVKQWFVEGLSSFFHLEGKTLTTLRDMLIPGKMVQNYLSGKRARYVHPLRMLLFTTIIFFTTNSLLDSEAAKIVNIGDNDPNNTVVSVGTGPLEDDDENYVEEQLAPLDSMKRAVQDKMRTVDIFRSSYLSFIKAERLKQKLQDSFPQLNTEETYVNLISTTFPHPDSAHQLDLNIKTPSGQKIDISPSDLSTKSGLEIAKASNLETWYERAMITKAVSLTQSGVESLNQYLYSNLTWAVLLFVPFMALGYFLFYWKKLPFYAQNLSYVAYIMAVGLILATLALTLTALTKSYFPAIACFATFVIYSAVSERRVFQSSYRSLFFKQVGLGFFALFTFVISFVLWLLLVIAFS